jgi:DNA-binding NtrC family response regulator
MAHDWPGNVREMRNAADRFVLEHDGDRLEAGADAPNTLAQQMDVIEKTLIEQALRQHQGRVPKVMEALGIAKKTLYDKLHRHSIDPDRFR